MCLCIGVGPSSCWLASPLVITSEIYLLSAGAENDTLSYLIGVVVQLASKRASIACRSLAKLITLPTNKRQWRCFCYDT